MAAGFESVDLGAPTGADNRLIDADLASAYADHHFEQAGFVRLLTP